MKILSSTTRMPETKLQEFKVLGDYLHWAAEYFDSNDVHFGHGTDNAWDEAVMLALHVLQLPADVEDDALDLPLNKSQSHELQRLAIRRVEDRLPVPYLTNVAWFGGARYYVNQHVIIPRSPCAELIDQELQPWLGKHHPHKILDLCTGSGCIAIHCSKVFSDCIIDAADISSSALEVAQKNIQLHNANVNLYESDLFSALPPTKYDVIISNPPYVGAMEMQSLPREYQYEPKLALESGVDGLELTEQILRQAKAYLQPHGLLIVEVGNSWMTLAARHPKLRFTWLEFAQGGEGVFLLRAEDLC